MHPQIPILYFGQHLDFYIPSETPKCNGNVTKEAIEFLNENNRKSECSISQTCENKRYTATHRITNLDKEWNKTAVYVAFDNPEVEYRFTYISYDLLSLIGEVGGILGLTLGASLITLFDSIFLHLPYY